MIFNNLHKFCRIFCLFFLPLIRTCTWFRACTYTYARNFARKGFASHEVAQTRTDAWVCACDKNPASAGVRGSVPECVGTLKFGRVGSNLEVVGVRGCAGETRTDAWERLHNPAGAGKLCFVTARRLSRRDAHGFCRNFAASISTNGTPPVWGI